MPALASAAMARAAAAPILLHLLLLVLADLGLGPAAAVHFDYASLTLGRALYDEFFLEREYPIRACSVIPVPCGLDEIGKNMKDFGLFGI
jgi:hypothetical protein